MPEIKKSSRRQRKISADIHVDEKFLQYHLQDVKAETAWRRELEFRSIPIISGREFLDWLEVNEKSNYFCP